MYYSFIVNIKFKQNTLMRIKFLLKKSQKKRKKKSQAATSDMFKIIELETRVSDGLLAKYLNYFYTLDLYYFLDIVFFL